MKKLSNRYLDAKVYPLSHDYFITRRERIEDDIQLIAECLCFYGQDKNTFHLEVAELAEKDLKILQSGKHKAKTCPIKEKKS